MLTGLSSPCGFASSAWLGVATDKSGTTDSEPTKQPPDGHVPGRKDAKRPDEQRARCLAGAAPALDSLTQKMLGDLLQPVILLMRAKGSSELRISRVGNKFTVDLWNEAESRPSDNDEALRRGEETP